jgi:hypothetical protein
LQWPHQGAKTARGVSNCSGNVSLISGELTLCEHEVVLLDKGLEVVLVELLDVGSGDDSRHESGADGGVLHLEACVCVWWVEW